MWELHNILLGNFLSFYLYFLLKTALFLNFSYKVLRVLLRLVWSQKSYSTSLILQVWEYHRTFKKWKSINLSLSGSIGIKGYILANVIAEVLKGIAYALLYIVRTSSSFFFHLLFKSFYYIFYYLRPYVYLFL